jgi:hypothetical protein
VRGEGEGRKLKAAEVSGVAHDGDQDTSGLMVT